MITFAVDTSVMTTSVALLDEDTVRGEIFVHTGRNHAEVLLPLIERLLLSLGANKDDVDLFAVTAGPGSFTGLRVGISTVKGLAFVLKKPVAAVCTLDALARNMPCPDTGFSICPMVDAGRGEVYTALYAPSGEKTISESIAKPAEFIASIKGDVIFLGGGADKYCDLIGERLSGRSYLAPAQLNHIKAASVGLVGWENFCKGNITDIIALAPNYLRPSYATGTD